MYSQNQLEIIKIELEKSWDNIIYNSTEVINYLTNFYKWDDIDMINGEVIFLVACSINNNPNNGYTYVIGSGKYDCEWDNIIQFKPKDSTILDIVKATPKPIDNNYNPILEWFSVF